MNKHHDIYARTLSTELCEVNTQTMNNLKVDNSAVIKGYREEENCGKGNVMISSMLWRTVKLQTVRIFRIR